MPPGGRSLACLGKHDKNHFRYSPPILAHKDPRNPVAHRWNRIRRLRTVYARLQPTRISRLYFCSSFVRHEVQNALLPQQNLVQERADHDPHDGADVHAECGRDDSSCRLQDGLRWPRHQVLRRAVQVQLETRGGCLRGSGARGRLLEALQSA